jgi:beta-galactosidase
MPLRSLRIWYRTTLCLTIPPLLLVLALFSLKPARVVRGTGVDVYTANNVASLPTTVRLQPVGGLMIPFAYGQPWPSFDQQSDHLTSSLAGTWKKQRVYLDHDLSLTDRSIALTLIESEGNGRHLPSYNDSSWETKTLPAVENTVPITEDLEGAEVYEDGVWYRRTFTVDSAWQGKQARLVFLAVNYVADVWVNGTWVGYHEGGYTPFALDVTDYLNYDSISNTIAVRVDNPPWDSRTDIVPAKTNDWHNYTGIIQDIYLEQLPIQYVARADIRPLDTNGNLSVNVVLFNAGDTSQILTADVEVYTTNVTDMNITSPDASDLIDSPVSLSGDTSQPADVPGNGTCVLAYEVGIPAPRLWTPADPNLYVLKVTLGDGGSVVDEFYTQFGVRTMGIGVDAKFLLNGHPVFLTGMARHEDWPGTGRSATMEKIKTDLDLIKETNVNFLRTAHYPNHPYTYLLADRMGLMVMEEIPTWQFGTYEWADQTQRRVADQMWREMIFRDYNRPSVVLWSGTNEAEKTSLERRRAFLARINRDLKVNYYDGRLVTQSAAADRPGADDHTMNAVDVAGWTTYFGVFYGDTYNFCQTAYPGEHYTGTLNFLDAAHANFPNKPILNTEFGCWSAPDDSLASVQMSVFSDTFKAVEDRKAVDSSGNLVGDGFTLASTWWTSFNWYTQIAKLQTMGASHMNRTTHKPVRAAMQARYAPYYTIGGLSNTTMSPLAVEIPDVYSVSQPSNVPAALLQDFEYEDSYYEGHQANTSLSTEIKYSGNSSLIMTGTGGEWHTVGVYLYNRPANVNPYGKICIWVYDTVGTNTMGLRLLDTDGASQTVWSDAENACDNPQTRRNSWVRMCFNLTLFNQVDLSALNKVQLTMFWDGVYYFDDITIVPLLAYLPLIMRAY